MIRIPFVLVLLSVVLLASSASGEQITRRTKLAKVTFLITDRPAKESVHVSRNWGSRESSPPHRLRYPALVGISYVTERGTFQFPAHLVAGIGLLDLQLLTDVRAH